MNVCRRCGVEVRQSAYGWGHTSNPANGHHYVRVARPAHGDRALGRLGSRELTEKPATRARTRPADSGFSPLDGRSRKRAGSALPSVAVTFSDALGSA